MNTPAHLLLGAAVFGHRMRPALVWAGFAGAMVPDLSLYLMAGVALFVMQIDPEVVFGQLYRSRSWQTVFAIDNSFFVWGALLFWGFWRRSSILIAFAGAGLLHIALDFPLHHDDGRAHFWPITAWVFESPLSYWDRHHGAGVIAPFELLLALAAYALVIWRKPRLPIWIFASVLILAELFVIYQWLFVFSRT